MAIFVCALVLIPQASAGLIETGDTVFMLLGDLPGGRGASSALAVAIADYDPNEVIAVELDGKNEGGTPVLRSANDGALEVLIVGESSSAETGSNASEAFAWTEAEDMVGLRSLTGGSFQSRALGVSRDGRTIVGSSSSSFTGSNALEAFLNDADGVVKLGDLPGGQYRGEAFGVSSFGEVVVGASSSGRSGANSSEAFAWTEEDGISGLGSLEGGQFRSAALGVSSDGGVIVGWSSSSRSGANSSEAFVWTEDEGMMGLGSLSGGRFASDARAVSHRGATIVGASSSGRSGSNGSEAFVWSEEGGMVGLGFLSGGFRDSAANAVTNDGKIVVGRSKTPSMDDAFIWDDEKGLRSIADELTREGIDLKGWRLLNATGVVRVPASRLVVVVGTALDPAQREEAFIATLPEPGATSTQLAVLLTLTALARRARRAPPAGVWGQYPYSDLEPGEGDPGAIRHSVPTPTRIRNAR
jgi:probable HAF family extracellular repeat protein